MNRIRLVLVVAAGCVVAAAFLVIFVANAANLNVAAEPLAPFSSSVVVPLNTPTISLSSSAGGNGGLTPVTTSATLANGTGGAIGTLTFQLWRDGSCTVPFGAASVVNVNGADSVAYGSGSQTPDLAGVYRWTAAYSGDADNSPIASVCGAANSTVLITVGPAAGVSIGTQPEGGAGGAVWGAQPSVSVVDAGGNIVTASSATITLSIGTNPSAGTLSCDSNSLAAVAGVAAFAGCRIDVSGNGYTLMASSAGLTVAISVGFNISVGPAVTLAFLMQPGGGDGNAVWPVQPSVVVRDAGGNVVTASSATVSLAIGTNPGSGTLSCAANPLGATSGTASFSGCMITISGVGYTLTATSAGLMSATSSAFPITDSPMTYSAIGLPATATSNSTQTVTYPSGTSTNDLLFLVEMNSTNSSSSTPSGWTQLVNQSATGPTAFRFRVWTRLCAGEASVSFGFKTGSAGSSAWVVRYRRSSGYPPNPATATASIGQGNSAASATMTPTTDLTTNSPNAVVISIVAIRAANVLSLGTPQLFGLRLARTNVPVGGQGVAMAVSDAPAVANPTTLVSPTWSQSGTPARWAWATIAYK